MGYLGLARAKPFDFDSLEPVVGEVSNPLLKEGIDDLRDWAIQNTAALAVVLGGFRLIKYVMDGALNAWMNVIFNEYFGPLSLLVKYGQLA